VNIKKAFPYLVACYLIVVGLFFIIASWIDTPFLDTQPPGSYLLSAVSIIFIGVGACYIYLLYKGKITKAGKSIAEVRQEAVEKMKDPGLLAKIALEDSNPETRKAAKERLEDLKIL